MRKNVHVAVLGTGIMGASTALLLVRLGARVTLFDAARAPFDGASRWNEGKIHLGFLYSADRSLRTAKRVVPGGLAFRDLVEELIGQSIEPAIAPQDDVYLVHRESVVEPDAMKGYFREVADMLADAGSKGRYLGDLSDPGVQAMTPGELASMADPAAVSAGYRVPERSVSTRWIADRYVEAINAEPAIDMTLGARVTEVRPAQGSADGPWLVQTGRQAHGPYDFVVNALWESRLAIDHTAGLQPPAEWSHRYRLCLFVHTLEAVDIPSAVVAAGPFGDIKNYTGRDFYLSWYPAGLVAEGTDLEPPRLPPLGDAARARIAESTWGHLAALIPSVKVIAGAADTVRVDGGWVFAAGRGPLADPQSSLHRRDRIGVRRLGSYISVDTGKYSMAPWLARDIAARIAGG